MPQLKPHNPCRLLSRAFLRKYNAVNQYRRHGVAYTRHITSKVFRNKKRHLQVINSTYKSWHPTKFNTKIVCFSKNGHNQSQKAYNQADFLDIVLAIHSPDLFPSQKKKQNIIWVGWVHFSFITPSDNLAELYTPHTRYPFRSLTTDFPNSLPRASHKEERKTSKTQ